MKLSGGQFMQKRKATTSVLLAAVVIGILPVMASAKIIDPSSVEVCVTREQVSTVVDVKHNANGLSVYKVDNVKYLDEQLNKQLPIYNQSNFKSQDQYVAQVKQLVSDYQTQHLQEIKGSWKGIYTCMNYNVTKTPAVIINGSYVVYGDTVSNAVKKWRTHTVSSQKQNEASYED